MSSRYVIANDRAFKTLVISSWKYAGACASLNGTFRYLYFPKGDVKAALGIKASLRSM